MALGFFNRLKEGLTRSTQKLTGGISAVFVKRKLDDAALEELEELLIGADLGVDAARRIIEGFRSLAGATDPTVAAPGSIRGDLARDWGRRVIANIVHGSDSPESAAREIGLAIPRLAE